MKADYLPNVIKLFKYYKMLGDKTIAQVNDEQLLWKYNTESNSIANIVKHLSGNMLSRWTNFLTSDGEKEWRNRDEEFENDLNTRKEILQKWEEGWHCLFKTLNQLKEEDLSKEIYIRNQGQTVLDAINRQLAHYPMHVGQIIYIGKMACSDQWISLSIPKGASKEYNDEKFSSAKTSTHFTEEYLDGKKKL